MASREMFFGKRILGGQSCIGRLWRPKRLSEGRRRRRVG
jgi:hypothetical protein